MRVVVVRLWFWLLLFHRGLRHDHLLGLHGLGRRLEVRHVLVLRLYLRGRRNRLRIVSVLFSFCRTLLHVLCLG